MHGRALARKQSLRCVRAKVRRQGDEETRRHKTTYTGAEPSVVMMGFRPSFFLFLFMAALATAAGVEFVPFPFAPVIRGRVAEGAVGGVASRPAGAVDLDTVIVGGAVAAPGAVSGFVVLPFVPFIFATSCQIGLKKWI